MAGLEGAVIYNEVGAEYMIFVTRIVIMRTRRPIRCVPNGHGRGWLVAIVRTVIVTV